MESFIAYSGQALGSLSCNNLRWTIISISPSRTHPVPACPGPKTWSNDASGYTKSWLFMCIQCICLYYSVLSLCIYHTLYIHCITYILQRREISVVPRALTFSYHWMVRESFNRGYCHEYMETNTCRLSWFAHQYNPIDEWNVIPVSQWIPTKTTPQYFSGIFPLVHQHG